MIKKLVLLFFIIAASVFGAVTNVVKVITSEDVSRNRFVSLDSNNLLKLADPGDAVFGLCQDKKVSGAEASVIPIVRGIEHVVADGAISAYVSIYLSNNGYVSATQVSGAALIGTSLEAATQRGNIIKAIVSKAEGASSNGSWVVPSDIPEPPSDFPVIGSATSAEANNELLIDWIEKFDALPYDQKYDLGACTNPQTYASAVPHVFEYHYGNPDGIPVLIIAGIHGSEGKTIAAIYWLAWCCENATTPYFVWMKNNINLRIIPCANPQGTILWQRRNNANASSGDNDVDIARNFDWRWGSTLFTADNTTEIITLASDIFSNTDVVHVSNKSGALPAGLAINTDYYIITDGADGTYQLSATEGGAAIDITDDGTGTNYIEDVTDITFSGPSAESELETQYLANKMATTVSCVGTITGTITAGDTVTQSISQAIGKVVSNTGTGANATLVIRVTSTGWIFESGTTTGYEIVVSAGVNEQADPVVTVTQAKPYLVIDCHTMAGTSEANIEVAMPNYQTYHDNDVSRKLKAMATPIINDTQDGYLKYFNLATMGQTQAVGQAVNYAASLKTQAYTFEGDSASWTGDDSSTATIDFVRSYTGSLACAISLADKAVFKAKPQNIMFQGATAKTFGTAGATWGPDSSDTYAWTWESYAGTTQSYNNPGIIYLESMSDVIINFSGSARGSGASPRATITMWLDDSTDTEVGTLSADDYYVDCPDGKYKALVGPTAVYLNLSKGFYDLRVNIDSSADSILVWRIQAHVEVVPVTIPQPKYFED